MLLQKLQLFYSYFIFNYQYDVSPRLPCKTYNFVSTSSILKCYLGDEALLLKSISVGELFDDFCLFVIVKGKLFIVIADIES